MIDVHCHILPQSDDGARNVKESIEMAEAALQQGVHTIIATPHHKNGRYENTKKKILDMVADLNDVFKKESIEIEVIAGQELRLNGEILEDFEKGEILPVNQSSGYIFIELPSSHVPHYTDKLLYELQVKGLVPIIVHPERNSAIAEQPVILYNLIKNGALSQLTASSIAGDFGKNIKKLSFQMIEANLVHFIGSDAHNVSNRCFRMTEAYVQIDKKFGLEMSYQYMENAEMLIMGASVYKEIPEKIKKKKFLGVF